MKVWNKDGKIFEIYGTRENDGQIEFYLYDTTYKQWFWENVKLFTPYLPYLEKNITYVKDNNGRVFVLYGTRERDGETEFLLFYKECIEWFWLNSKDYTPYIAN